MMAVVTVTAAVMVAVVAVVTRAAFMTEMNLSAKAPHVSSQFVSSNSSETDAILSLFY